MELFTLTSAEKVWTANKLCTKLFKLHFRFGQKQFSAKSFQVCLRRSRTSLKVSSAKNKLEWKNFPTSTFLDDKSLADSSELYYKPSTTKVWMEKINPSGNFTWWNLKLYSLISNVGEKDFWWWNLCVHFRQKVSCLCRRAGLYFYLCRKMFGYKVGRKSFKQFTVGTNAGTTRKSLNREIKSSESFHYLFQMSATKVWIGENKSKLKTSRSGTWTGESNFRNFCVHSRLSRNNKFKCRQEKLQAGK